MPLASKPPAVDMASFREDTSPMPVHLTTTMSEPTSLTLAHIGVIQ